MNPCDLAAPHSTATSLLRHLATSQFGATVGQSLGAHLIIGSTFKLVRAGRTTATAGFAGDSFDDAANLDVPLETRGDLDIGAMAVIERVRLGVSVKHGNEPAFGDGGSRFALARQARAGFVFSTAAFSTELRGTANSLTVAADLTKTATAFGNARHLAAGVEVWLLGRHLALRGGASTRPVCRLKGRAWRARSNHAACVRCGPSSRSSTHTDGRER